MLGQVVLLALLCCCSVYGQTGCPGCIVNLPDELPEDTIFLTDAPDGRGNEPYEGTVSFRLPKSTTPVAAVDPETAPGINLDRITIKSISNLPPGLSWEANQLEFDVKEETDGCMKFCGRPLQPGLYLVEVVIEARVLVINQTTFFTFPIEILPAERSTEGFTIVNSSGCGRVEAGFVNGNPSGGLPGFSYFWDFGNGHTSEEEMPAGQVYEDAGEYEVNYRAIIDTVGVFLTEVVLEEVDCSDALGGRPDLYIKVFDGTGEEVLSSPTTNNADLPLSISVNLPVDTGTYLLQVFDNDSGLGGADDLCGEASFSRLAGGRLTGNNFAAEVSLIHPVDTITSSDTVRVFPFPDEPLLSLDSGSGPFCRTDTLVLSSTVSGRWYRNEVPLASSGNAVRVFDGGAYRQVFTDVSGCQSQSELLEFTFSEIPAAPVFTVEDNLLAVFEEELLPTEFSLEWRFGDMPLPGVESTRYCAENTGRYQLEVTDLATGCTNAYSRQVSVDPAIENCNVTSLVNEETGITAVQLFPNPAAEWVELQLDFTITRSITWILLDARGRVVQRDEFTGRGTGYRTRIDLSNHPAGVYFLHMRSAEHVQMLQLIKK